MSDHWSDVAALAFISGIVFGGGIFVSLKRRLYARFEPKQRIRIGANGLGGSAVVSFALLCIRPDVPASFAYVAFLWGMASFFSLLLSVSDKAGPSKFG